MGADLPGEPKLGTLTAKILKMVPDLKRLRLSSIDSIEADEDLMQVIADDHRLMPHFHLSLQAGDDMILKRMKRRHLRADTIKFCEDVRKMRPDVVFGADIIAGFPTETEEMFGGGDKGRARRSSYASDWRNGSRSCHSARQRSRPAFRSPVTGPGRSAGRTGASNDATGT
jgi:hypothetical protein